MTEEIIIKSKEQYETVQKDLLSKGFKWIDGFAEYYDLFEILDNDFSEISFIVNHKNKSFSWADLPE